MIGLWLFSKIDDFRKLKVIRKAHLKNWRIDKGMKSLTFF